MFDLGADTPGVDLVDQGAIPGRGLYVRAARRKPTRARVVSRLPCCIMPVLFLFVAFLGLPVGLGGPLELAEHGIMRFFLLTGERLIP